MSKQKEKEGLDLFKDPQYICKSSALITDSLRQGSEVVQMPNGDIMVSEIKRVTNQYHWSGEKKKFKRTSTDIG
jgi:hypothetical protein